MNVEEALCATVAGLRYRDLPESTVSNTKRVLLDTVGTMFAGSSQEGAAAIAKWASGPRRAGEATVCSFGGMGRSTDVAVANGYMAHALDFDDTLDEAELHTGVAVIPAVLAAAECSGIADGERLIEAIVCGTEVLSRLGLGVLNSPFDYGWVYTSVLGSIGAAAAVAKLLGGDDADIWNAMGIAYSESAGNCQPETEGTLAKRLQPGLAAGAGVRAAELALAGLTGPRGFVNGKYGLASLYFRGQYDASRVVRRFGSEWQIDQLSFKPYPCCRVIHGAIDLVLAAVDAGKLRPEALRSMRVGTSAGGQKDLGEPAEQKRRPNSFIDCQFSLPWVAALVTVNGRGLKVQDMGPFHEADPEVKRVADLISTHADPRIGARAGAREASLAFETLEGETYEAMVSTFYGSPDDPMSDDALAAKFEDCASMANTPLPHEAVVAVRQSIMDLEDLQSSTAIGEMLAPLRHLDYLH
ncbi:MmgE/PrpD family protein [Streptomyces sp. NPDC017964]|uniref:MmgE/PrpD family protein n=1 Tax=Streptomyces sp. NPDC017964 TaxID=3365022 RepID=UPI003790105B